MRKLIIFLFIFAFLSTDVFAYVIKVYNEYGQQVGLYRKQGKEYVLYDLNNNQVKTEKDLIRMNNNRQVPIEKLQTFYNYCGDVIGTWDAGFKGTNGTMCAKKYIYHWSRYPLIETRPYMYEDTRFPKFR